MSTPEVTYRGIIDMQVCVPSDWIDAQILHFAERENPCGTMAGWGIRREGSPRLGGSKEREPCDSREGHVHVMLDA